MRRDNEDGNGGVVMAAIIRVVVAMTMEVVVMMVIEPTNGGGGGGVDCDGKKIICFLFFKILKGTFFFLPFFSSNIESSFLKKIKNKSNGTKYVFLSQFL